MSGLKNIAMLVKNENNNSSKYVTKEDRFLNELSDKLDNINDTYIYVKATAKYYWVEKKIFFSPNEVCNNLNITAKELKSMRDFGMIETYDDITYYQGGKDGCYNLLDEKSILNIGTDSILHPHIEELVSNVCGHKEENIEYLHKAVLYKYNNINDVTLPAIVLYGKGGSGKGTLMSMLGSLFGNENILDNLGQRDLTSDFDTYSGQKLIVEFAEVSTNNTHGDIQILNKLKNIIGAPVITINPKGVRQYQIENIAWFFISSNSNKPLQLDDKDKGNRRFTIIKSDSSLSNGKEINETIRDKEVMSNYLARLHTKYPDVLSYSCLNALDNEDKRDLEERGQNEANQFWEWLEDNFPDYTGKRKKIEIEDMVNMFCSDNGIDEQEFLKYFWSNSKYSKKKIRIGEDTFYGVDIPIRA